MAGSTGRLTLRERLTGKRRQQPNPGGESDYDLQIDQQSNTLIGLKQQLTYFIITGSVASIAFVVTFIGSPFNSDAHITFHPLDIALLSLASVVGLLCAAAALLHLNFGHESFTLHVRYRYQRKAWSDLAKAEQDHWDRITKRSQRFLAMALLCLFGEFLVFAGWFAVLFTLEVPRKG
jgi:hypothetical protein